MSLRTEDSSAKITEIDLRTLDAKNFSGKSHRELIRKSQLIEKNVSQLVVEVEKQSRSTREELRTNVQKVLNFQIENEAENSSELTRINRTIDEIRGYKDQLNDIETRVRKLANIYQRETKAFHDAEAEILAGLRLSNNLDSRNYEILNLLERKIVNKLRVNPELSNVRVRVERMERRLIGLLERQRSESKDSFDLVPEVVRAELDKMKVSLLSEYDAQTDNISNQVNSLERLLSEERASIIENLDSSQSQQIKKWTNVVSVFRTISENIELLGQELDVKKLTSSMDIRSKHLESLLEDLRENVNARLHEVSNELERVGDLARYVNLSKDSLAALAGEVARDSLNSRRQLRRHITETVRDSTRQMEALVKLAPRMAEVDSLIPPTGGYALDAQALLHLIDVLEREQPKVIVEFGGGTSTIWMAYICKKFGTRIISIDHLEEYLSRTQLEVDRHGLSDIVELRLAPLEQIQVGGEEYSWYSPGALKDLANVDLLFVDGPPESTGPNARRPAVYVMAGKLNDSAVIVLDDTHRESEQETVREWISSFPKYKVVDENISRLTVLESEEIKS
ncbi:class I SAM-dependent methyltransferase [Glutamicibacter sp. HZAU]|uniref:class I SAM-dependent methyltransferase n=1 Tax=Glutamicibacter sp. HZAU TaxID=2049891 RepID=UPI0013755FE4|nr:class I SAM-dependent methyltransferase [Glutamicibacter sp. HZAU]